jgi:F0F1-type ATP synthase assembly protein I
MNNRKKKPTFSSSPYLRLTSAGLQMAGVITLSTYGGFYLDQRFKNDTPWCTILLGLVGVGLGLYLIIREVMEINKNDEE